MYIAFVCNYEIARIYIKLATPQVIELARAALAY